MHYLGHQNRRFGAYYGILYKRLVSDNLFPVRGTSSGSQSIFSELTSAAENIGVSPVPPFSPCADSSGFQIESHDVTATLAYQPHGFSVGKKSALAKVEGKSSRNLLFCITVSRIFRCEVRSGHEGIAAAC